MLQEQIGTPDNSSNVMSFLFSDWLLERKEAQKMMNNIQSPILAAGLAEPNVVHLFDSQEAFDHWMHRTRYASRFEQVNKIVNYARRNHPQEAKKPSVRLVSNSPLEDRVSPERSEIVRGLSYDPRSIAWFFENTDHQGSAFTLGPAAIPDLMQVSGQKQITSLKISGVCMLTDQLNFGGARLYLVGEPNLDIVDLRSWGFGIHAASAIVL